MRGAGNNAGSRSGSGLKTVTALSLLVLGFLAGLIGLNFLVPLQSSCTTAAGAATTYVLSVGENHDIHDTSGVVTPYDEDNRGTVHQAGSHEASRQGISAIDREIELRHITRIPESASSLAIAYCVQATSLNSKNVEQLERLLNLLLSHENSLVALHLDGDASADEHQMLRDQFGERQNVHILPSSVVAYKGITMVDITLRAMAHLLALGRKWHYFINLSAVDYPLVTQNDLRKILFTIAKEDNMFYNYIQIEPKPMTASIRDVAVDSGLYDARNATLNEHAGKRGWPYDFQVCKGSAWMILSRPFCHYLINGGTDGIPRRLLMYFANYARPAEEYFHTVAKNSGFFATIIPDDMRFIFWPIIEGRGAQHPAYLDSWETHMTRIQTSGTIFARKFKPTSTFPDFIDSHVHNNVTYYQLVENRIRSRFISDSARPLPPNKQPAGKCFRGYVLLEEPNMSVKELMQTGRGNVDSPVTLVLKPHDQINDYHLGDENLLLL